MKKCVATKKKFVIYKKLTGLGFKFRNGNLIINGEKISANKFGYNYEMPNKLLNGEINKGSEYLVNSYHKKYGESKLLGKIHENLTDFEFDIKNGKLDKINGEGYDYKQLLDMYYAKVHGEKLELGIGKDQNINSQGVDPQSVMNFGQRARNICLDGVTRLRQNNTIRISGILPIIMCCFIASLNIGDEILIPVFFCLTLIECFYTVYYSHSYIFMRNFIYSKKVTKNLLQHADQKIDSKWNITTHTKHLYSTFNTNNIKLYTREGNGNKLTRDYFSSKICHIEKQRDQTIDEYNSENFQDAYSYIVWKLGFFQQKELNKSISALVETRELGEITVWYDTMSNLSFMSPELFEELQTLQVQSQTNICVRTGNENTFIVSKFIPIHIYNPSGDEVLVP